jgi:transcriptional regulator with XRE-family HTH domain
VDLDIGARIRAARKEAGLSQEEVARRSGIGLKNVGDIERGTVTDPHFSTLLAIASAIDVRLEELLEAPDPKVVAPPLSPPKREAHAQAEEQRRWIGSVYPALVLVRRFCERWERLDEATFDIRAYREYGTQESDVVAVVNAWYRVVDREGVGDADVTGPARVALRDELLRLPGVMRKVADAALVLHEGDELRRLRRAHADNQDALEGVVAKLREGPATA